MKLYRLKKEFRDSAVGWGWRPGRAKTKQEFWELPTYSYLSDCEGVFIIVDEDRDVIAYNVKGNFSGWHYASDLIRFYDICQNPSQIWRQLDKTYQNH